MKIKFPPTDRYPETQKVMPAVFSFSNVGLFLDFARGGAIGAGSLSPRMFGQNLFLPP
jgi:hypothetical protein